MPIRKAQSAAQPEQDAPNPRASIGGNNPPPDEQVRLDFRELMLEKAPTYEQRIADLKAAAERAKVEDDDSAGKVGDLVRQIRAMQGAINDSHKTAKEPYLTAGRAADTMKRELMGPLDDAKADVEGKLNGYLRAKREEEERKAREAREEAERKAREEAERRAEEERARREAEEAGKPLPDPEPIPEPEPEPEPEPVAKGPIRSSVTGGAVSAKTVTKVRIIDWKKAARSVSDDPKVQEAIEAAALRRAKAGVTAMPGVEIYEDVQASVR